jgi:hypothetical protein
MLIVMLGKFMVDVVLLKGSDNVMKSLSLRLLDMELSIWRLSSFYGFDNVIDKDDIRSKVIVLHF